MAYLKFVLDLYTVRFFGPYPKGHNSTCPSKAEVLKSIFLNVYFTHHQTWVNLVRFAMNAAAYKSKYETGGMSPLFVKASPSHLSWTRW